LRVPLEFDRHKTRLSVTVSVRFTGRPPIPVMLIVDTGSPVTFVDEYNSSKVRVFAKNLPFDHDALLGGTKIAVHNAGKAVINFRTSEDELLPVEFSSMKIARTEWTRKEAVYSSTSVLGLDFFLENKALLYVNPYKGVAYMDVPG